MSADGMVVINSGISNEEKKKMINPRLLKERIENPEINFLNQIESYLRPTLLIINKL